MFHTKEYIDERLNNIRAQANKYHDSTRKVQDENGNKLWEEYYDKHIPNQRARFNLRDTVVVFDPIDVRDLASYDVDKRVGTLSENCPEELTKALELFRSTIKNEKAKHGEALAKKNYTLFVPIQYSPSRRGSPGRNAMLEVEVTENGALLNPKIDLGDETITSRTKAHVDVLEERLKQIFNRKDVKVAKEDLLTKHVPLEGRTEATEQMAYTVGQVAAEAKYKKLVELEGYETPDFLLEEKTKKIEKAKEMAGEIGASVGDVASEGAAIAGGGPKGISISQVLNKFVNAPTGTKILMGVGGAIGAGVVVAITAATVGLAAVGFAALGSVAVAGLAFGAAIGGFVPGVWGLMKRAFNRVNTWRKGLSTEKVKEEELGDSLNVIGQECADLLDNYEEEVGDKLKTVLDKLSVIDEEGELSGEPKVWNNVLRQVNTWIANARLTGMGLESQKPRQTYYDNLKNEVQKGNLPYVSKAFHDHLKAFHFHKAAGESAYLNVFSQHGVAENKFTEPRWELEGKSLYGYLDEVYKTASEASEHPGGDVSKPKLKGVNPSWMHMKGAEASRAAIKDVLDQLPEGFKVGGIEAALKEAWDAKMNVRGLEIQENVFKEAFEPLLDLHDALFETPEDAEVSAAQRASEAPSVLISEVPLGARTARTARPARDERAEVEAESEVEAEVDLFATAQETDEAADIEATQESTTLESENAQLRARIAELEAKNEELENQVSELSEDETGPGPSSG